MVVLELQYLYEIKRLNETSEKFISRFEKSIGLQVDKTRFIDVASESLKITWTRDPFDRLIVANALLHNSKLITKDDRILGNYENAVW